ncbi:hypothetical protein PInf_013145 [Phytophthora infestans]|nr:hypothetical protein PInf_013145 [Phytophthora infestans]
MYAYATEKTFAHMWNELTKKGWKFRKSLGLSDDRRYLPPGGSLKGTEGVDYFLEPPILDTTQVVPGTTYQTGPDIPDERTDNPEVAIPEALNAARAGLRTGVSLDDFDSDDFINALRWDTLFEDLDADDFNRGGEDWLRALDSDAEGDEELILQDGNDDESVDDIASVASDESGDDLANEDDDVPVDFDLTSEDLDNLRAGGWDVYMEQQSCQVLREGSSLYEGPSGPTRAALAYAENPLSDVVATESLES